jgi:hypothetical protein
MMGPGGLKMGLGGSKMGPGGSKMGPGGSKMGLGGSKMGPGGSTPFAIPARWSSVLVRPRSSPRFERPTSVFDSRSSLVARP